MLLRRAPGFVAALILLPLSILAPAIPGYTMMICRLTGTAVPADCGGSVTGDAPAAPTPVDSGWQAASCCDVLRVAFDRPPAEAHAEAPAMIAAFFVPSRPLVRPALEAAADASLPAPPGLGPPLRLITQTFLI